MTPEPGRFRPFRFLSMPLALSLGLAVLAGCSSQAELVPAPSDNTLTGSPAVAVTSVDSVEVTAEPGHWSGNPGVLDQLTPIKVSITNHGTQPVRVRYSDFALDGPKGVRYAALPPYSIGGTVERPELATDYPPIEEPEFESDDFDVAPYLGPMYPTLEPWEGSFYYDPYYYDNYYTYWQQVQLPTGHMLRWALPEGVVKPDGHVSGFLYFQRVSDKEPRVTYRQELVNAKTGNMFGTVSIPFTVKKG